MTRNWNVSGMVAGLLFALFGAAVLLDRLDYWNLDGDVVLPMVVIGLGAALLLRSLVRH